jgi:butyrate kinase
MTGGTYLVNADMLADLQNNRYGEHASNLGAIMAAGLAWPLGLPAYVVDPPVVDEMIPLARYTGLPQIRRRSAFHALNQRAVARLAASRLGLAYEEVNLIVAHLGGGISVAAHEKGRVIDVNDALEEGPFSPQRAGTMPSSQLLDLAGELGTKKLRRLLVGQGGLVAHCGTDDVTALAQRPDQAEVLAAMTYQVAKAIAGLAACFAGRVDGVILTGGLAHSQRLVRQIRQRVEFLGKVLVYPGEMELAALAAGALRVLEGQEQALHYQREADA